jgi:hypothetical protein
VGDTSSFEELDESVKRIYSIGFKRVRSVLATSEGLFEIDIPALAILAKSMSYKVILT